MVVVVATGDQGRGLEKQQIVVVVGKVRPTAAVHVVAFGPLDVGYELEPCYLEQQQEEHGPLVLLLFRP